MPPLTAALLYIQCLVNSFKNIASVRNYLSGARTFIIAAGGSATPLSAPLIATVLRGASRLANHVPQPAPPLSRSALLRLCGAVRLMGGDGRVAMAAVLFGVTTFLRQSNSLPHSLNVSGPHLIARGDFTWSPRGLLVLVRSTKTRHPPDAALTLLVAPAPGSPFCPVVACSCRSRHPPWLLLCGQPSASAGIRLRHPSLSTASGRLGPSWPPGRGPPRLRSWPTGRGRPGPIGPMSRPPWPAQRSQRSYLQLWPAELTCYLDVLLYFILILS